MRGWRIGLAMGALWSLVALPTAAEVCMVLGLNQDEGPQAGTHVKDISTVLSEIGACKILAPEEIRQRITNAPIPEINLDIKALSNVVDAGEFDFNNSDYERAIRRLTEAIDALRNKAPNSPEKFQELEHARLYLARSQLVLGKTEETLRVYQEILRANPAFSLDPARFSRKEMTLFTEAKESLDKGTLGSLEVLSTPSGAEVELEGRVVGKTPLHLRDKLWAGTYHIQLRKGKMESLPRQIVIGTSLSRLNVDLNFESRIKPWEGPGLHLGDRRWDLQGIVRLGSLASVDLVVATNLSLDEGQRYLVATLLEVGRVKEKRSGRIPLEMSDEVSYENLKSLVGFLFTGRKIEPVAKLRFEEGLPVVAEVSDKAATAPLLGNGPAEASPSSPWYRSWWFWTAVGAVVVGGVVAGTLASTGGVEEVPPGNLGKVTAPIAYPIR